MSGYSRRPCGAKLLAALFVLAGQPAGPASANPGPGEAAKAPETTGWTLKENGQLAVVGADNGHFGVFAGIQCDPFDPRSHRLIVGALHTTKIAGSASAVLEQSDKFDIRTQAPSLSARFAIYPEDRGQSNFNGGVRYTAAYLNQQQFDALRTAKEFVISSGTQRYAFSGAGSAQAIGAMACQSSVQHVARRLIANRREDSSTQQLGSWRLNRRYGAQGWARGSAEAFAITSNHPANAAATFKFGLSCSGQDLSAHLDVAINPDSTDEAGRTAVKTFIHDFDKHDKLVEVYRTGKRIATLLVGSDRGHGSGRALSSHDIASLMASDQLEVVGDNKVIEFSTVNAAPSLEELSRICSTQT